MLTQGGHPVQTAASPRSPRKVRFTAPVLLFSGLVGTLACSGDPQANRSSGPLVLPPVPGSSMSAAGAGNMGSAGATSGPSTSTLDPVVLFTPPDGSAGAGNADDFTVCTGDSVTTDPLPPILQLVVDTSLSMDSAAPGSEVSKWEETRDALLAAIDALPPETSVGLVFYPDMPLNMGGPGGPGAAGGACFDEEADVGIAELGDVGSTQRQAITQALQDQRPDGATPTHDAYVYALDELESFGATANQFVVLITDGVPTISRDCAETNLDGVDPAPLVTEATAASQLGVRTFVIGSPGSEDARESLSAIAFEGGTAPATCSNTGPDFCHFDMTTGVDFATGLAAALEQIADEVALSCNYDIPPPPGGRSVDPERVNVKLTLPSGEVMDIARDPSETDCNAGWQFGPGGDQVLLCADTCALVQQANASLALEFGCLTRVQ